MGIPLLAGRTFDSFDLEASSAAAGLEVSPVELPLVGKVVIGERLGQGIEQGQGAGQDRHRHGT